MQSFIQKIWRPFRRFGRREDGNATIEFAILFPGIMAMFLMSIETGVLLIRGVMLNRGLDISMRDLRLGTLTPMTHAGLKASICKNAYLIPDCEKVTTVELLPVSTQTWSPMDPTTTCRDRREKLEPVLQFKAGQKNEMMLVRVCSIFDPFFPIGALAAQIRTPDGGYALATSSAFVQEP